MTKYRFVKGAILLALVLMVTVVSAAHAQEADLTVTKEVSPGGPFAVNDTVTWVVTVWNNGPDDASDIILKEDISQLSDHGDITVDVDNGIYDSVTGNWTIPSLANATSTSLRLVTNFSTAGQKLNSVSITEFVPGDSFDQDNSAESEIVIFDGLLLSADLKIKPTTLNKNSKGVFTVFVTLKDGSSDSPDDEAEKPEIDFDSSTLTCAEAELIRASVSNKDGGTVIAKFYREDLRNVTNGTGVMVNCSGTLSVNGESIYVEGSDTIRVIEKKGLAKIFSDVKKFLRLEKDEAEINETENNTITTVTLNPESYKNKGQAKKIDQNSVSGTNPDDTQSDTTRGPKVKEVKNAGNNKKVQENTDGDATGKGNSNANKPDDESPGQSNSKKNK
jgi:hypothetical protein